MKTDKKESVRQLLDLWQDRLQRGKEAFSEETDLMDEREEIYRGTKKEIAKMIDKDETTKTTYVRNVVFEMIEAEISSEIKYPKVTPRRKQDENLARLIEDMIRGELDRLKMEYNNDMQERIVHIQGGSIWHIEWDNTKMTHTTVGANTISVIHPKQFCPQPGIFTGTDDMDYLILNIPTTKERVKRRWGIDVSQESEENPELKSTSSSDSNDDMITLHMGYYKNQKGGIGQIVWVNDMLCCHYEDYQARHLKRCRKCGAVHLPGMEFIGKETKDGNYPLNEDIPPQSQGTKKYSQEQCQYCGQTEFDDTEEDFEERYTPIIRSDGTVLFEGAGVESTMDHGIRTVGLGKPAFIPYYKPDVYPVVLQKNVSAYGKVLGLSDVEIMRDQQNGTNRLMAKIFDKTLTNGSYITLPPNAQIQVNSKEGKVIRISKPQDKQLIETFSMEQSINNDLTLLNVIYEDARNEIGITDSYQGKKDVTASSGVAKQTSASQASGRMESKRVMKNEAWERLFELIFKFTLAYCDEPRPVRSKDISTGETFYRNFNRYDFLEKDENGEWWWNDLFDFSCDSSSPLEKDRQALWQETRMNLQQGAFGDPSMIGTLLIFWRQMESLHYPHSAETIRSLEKVQEEQQQSVLAQANMPLQGGSPTNGM